MAKTKDETRIYKRDWQRAKTARKSRAEIDRENATLKEKRHTKKGFLIALYCNMLKRVRGQDKKKAHLYADMGIMPSAEFYEFANCVEFDELWEDYSQSNFQRKLAPSPDRLNNNFGYVHGNLEWVTMSENSRRGSINRHRVKSA